MSDASAAQKSLIAGLAILQVIYYGMVAASALLWFEVLLTLPAEYDRIWKRKITGATVVYLLLRYGAVVEMLFYTLQIPGWDVDQQTCGSYVYAGYAFTCITNAASAAFICLRVFAIGGRDWRSLVIVAPLSMIKPIVVAYLASTIVIFPVPGIHTCLPSSRLSNRTLLIASVVAILTTAAAETVLLAMTMAKTYTIKKDSIRTGMHTPLTDILIRNGSLHLLILILGLIVESLSHRYMDAYELTPALAFWLITPYLNESLNAIVLSRFILALRRDHFAEPSGSASSEASRGSLNFRGFSGSILRNLDAIPDVNSMPGRQQEDDVACEDTLVAGVRGPSTPSYTVSAPPDDATISLSE